ncbi:LysR family transcriptional regulator [Xylophilus rhododendri]|uniref:LysR family transcriptional regulator n=1 Tax=Xylophilus rhododendri TaxID=2697032 RepID=A0A857J647_9BURK|nr:LysR family transcriptional regulator [Xylophilus rhododendri]QHI98492.1 LysR family transcriptional regulator [Xylophilus rhododendri]
MPNNLKLRQLEGFVAAADSGSFTAAASAMAMTAPAFSQLVRELESTLGLVLFERTTRRLELTASGRQLLEGVRRPLADLAHVSSEMKALAGGQTGTVVLSILHSLAFGLGTRALAQLKTMRPDITVKMIEDMNEVLIERVRNREVDIGLGMFTQALEDIEFTPLFEDELVAVFSVDHPLRNQRTLTWKQLAETPLILLQPKSSVRRLVEAGLLVTGVARQPVTEVVSMVTAINMAAAGFGVTILPQLSLASLKMTGMAVRKIKEPRPRRQIGLLRKVGRASSPAEALLAIELAKSAAHLQLE